MSAHSLGSTVTELDPKQQAGGFTTPFSGLASVMPGTQSSLKRGQSRLIIHFLIYSLFRAGDIDLRQVGSARNAMMSVKLDQVL